eukprot:581838-Prymnesium_polylepis.2
MAISSGALRKVWSLKARSSAKMEYAVAARRAAKRSAVVQSVLQLAAAGDGGDDVEVLTISTPVVGAAGTEVTRRPRKKPVVAAVAICAEMPDTTVALAASLTWTTAVTTSELAFATSVISAACTLPPATDARSAL